MPAASMCDKFSHCWGGLKRDLKRAWKFKTLNLYCGMEPDECACGGRYHALRYFYFIPRNIFTYWFNPLHYLDRILYKEHNKVLRQVDHRLQWKYDGFQWDGRPRHCFTEAVWNNRSVVK